LSVSISLSTDINAKFYCTGYKVLKISTKVTDAAQE